LVREHSWVTASKCYTCNKTGKVPDPNDSEKQIKCMSCGGEGYHVTRGRTKAD